MHARLARPRLRRPLWELGGALLLDGVDAGRRMDAMTAKVEAAGGVPAAGDGAGRGIWCVPCGKLQPLAKPVELWPWDRHVRGNTHKDAARFRCVRQPPPPPAREFGSVAWRATRMAQWREIRAVRKARHCAREAHSERSTHVTCTCAHT